MNYFLHIQHPTLELWTISYYLVHIIFMTVVSITYDLQVRMLNYMLDTRTFLH